MQTIFYVFFLPLHPPILAVNASVYNEDNMRCGMDTRIGRFLMSTVEVRGEAEGVDDVESVTYELRGCVCNHSCIEYD